MIHDPVMELEVLGSMLVWPENVGRVLDILEISDFFVPAHQLVFESVKSLHQAGEKITTSAVIERAHRVGELPPGLLVAAQNAGTVDVSTAMRAVADRALRRRLIGAAAQMRKAAETMGTEATDTLEWARNEVGGIETPLIAREPDDESFDDFLARATAKPTPWLIHGLIREGWRSVVVAPEGIGKTYLLRQFAVCASFGINPLRFTNERPVSVLLMDLENPEDHIHSSLDRLVTQARRQRPDIDPKGRLWHRPGGIDLRKRSDRAEVENILAKRRPELVIAGPLYKLTRPSQNDNWETAAREVQGVFDDWRARYGISLLLEDHAGQGIAGGKRELRPYGSSMWLRWPEIGIGLQPAGEGRLTIERWRGDRMPTDWPTHLQRSKPWPWSGVWGDGMEEAI